MGGRAWGWRARGWLGLGVHAADRREAGHWGSRRGPNESAVSWVMVASLSLLRGRPRLERRPGPVDVGQRLARPPAPRVPPRPSAHAAVRRSAAAPHVLAPVGTRPHPPRRSLRGPCFPQGQAPWPALSPRHAAPSSPLPRSPPYQTRRGPCPARGAGTQGCSKDLLSCMCLKPCGFMGL